VADETRQPEGAAQAAAEEQQASAASSVNGVAEEDGSVGSSDGKSDGNSNGGVGRSGSIGNGGRRGSGGPQNGHASSGGNGDMEPPSAIKLLVSAGLAGCLIGKAGATINELQERTGARIKLSQNNDFFPGRRV